MNERERTKLLFGPYRCPAAAREPDHMPGPDALVVVTGVSDTRIPWPKCRPLEGRGRPPGF